MHTPDYGKTTVEEMVEHNVEASHVLRSYHIDVTASRHLSLDQVAQSVTTPTDEMLAVMESRVRRTAKKCCK